MIPFISVIVPVYKVPLDYLRVCLESLFAQTLQESEFIIISDGASEAECSICEEYARKDSRFKFFKNAHEGVSSTRNYGMNRAHGNYLTFIDADDWIEKNTCEELYLFLKQQAPDILIFPFKEHHPNGSTKNIRLYSHSKEKISETEINNFKRNTIHIFQSKYLPVVITFSKVYKKSHLIENKITFSKDLSIGEDRVFNFQAINATRKIAYLDKAFYHYNIYPSSSRSKCKETSLIESLSYINQLSKLSANSFANELGFEAISELWVFARKCPLKREYFIAMKEYVLSKDFQFFVKKIQKHSINPLFNLDIWAFKHQITHSLYLHLGIATIQRIIHKILLLG